MKIWDIVRRVGDLFRHPPMYAPILLRESIIIIIIIHQLLCMSVCLSVCPPISPVNRVHPRIPIVMFPVSFCLCAKHGRLQYHIKCNKTELHLIRVMSCILTLFVLWPNISSVSDFIADYYTTARRVHRNKLIVYDNLCVH